MTYRDQVLKLPFLIVDPEFLSMFSFPLRSRRSGGCPEESELCRVERGNGNEDSSEMKVRLENS